MSGPWDVLHNLATSGLGGPEFLIISSHASQLGISNLRREPVEGTNDFQSKVGEGTKVLTCRN